MPLPGESDHPVVKEPPAQAAPSDKPAEGETIAKADHEAAIKAATDSKASLEADLGKLKDQLLDPKYIQFLESQNKPEPPVKPKVEKGDSAEVAELKGAIAAMNTEMAQARQVQDTILAQMELQEVIKANPDFEEYRPDVQKILEGATNNLTIAQALHIARDAKRSNEAPAVAAPKKAPQSEKPNAGLPKESVKEATTFKTEGEAGTAAWEAVKEKYGLTSDTL